MGQGIDTRQTASEALLIDAMLQNRKDNAPAATVNLINDSQAHLKARDSGPPLPAVTAFAAWFAGSKVVDATGRPMVVYHGTADDFGAFDLDFSFDAGFHFGTADAAALRLRHLGFFTDELDPDHGPRLIPVYLSIRNPKRIDTDPYSEDFWGDEIEKARREGHDGIVYVNEVEGGLSWVAFRPEQIKSAIGNCGTFDPGNPLITQ